MINQYLVDILVKKIKNKEINPKTDKVFEVDDIKVEEYKVAVSELLAE